MDAVYEFRVSGTIGPVTRSAMPELTTEAAPPACVLSGSIPDRNDMAQLLEKLDELGLADTEMRIHRVDSGPPTA